MSRTERLASWRVFISEVWVADLDEARAGGVGSYNPLGFA